MVDEAKRAAGLKAARTIQRRMEGRLRYRRRRDRKLGDEYLGRAFRLTLRDELTGLPYYTYWRVMGYDPDRATVRLRATELGGPDLPDTLAWSTDEFWSNMRCGLMREV